MKDNAQRTAIVAILVIANAIIWVYASAKIAQFGGAL
jgi:hypothetical protein